jgi:hypothetical protein
MSTEAGVEYKGIRGTVVKRHFASIAGRDILVRDAFGN